MLFVAICDDEKKVSAHLESNLIEIFDKLSIKHEIDVFFAAEELSQKMESGAHYDLIFLDIVFSHGEINGVEVGRLIRDNYQNHIAAIVYISWEKSYALQLFEVQPFHFLIKPLEYKMIEEVIRKFLKTTGRWSGEFTYKKGHDTFKLRIKDIVYIESSDRKCILHLSDGNFEIFYGSLKNIYQEQLKRFDFLFIHNAYIINYDYIAALKFNQAYLIGSEVPLPISKLRRKEVREVYLEITKRRMM